MARNCVGIDVSFQVLTRLADRQGCGLVRRPAGWRDDTDLDTSIEVNTSAANHRDLAQAIVAEARDVAGDQKLFQGRTRGSAMGWKSLKPKLFDGFHITGTVGDDPTDFRAASSQSGNDRGMGGVKGRPWQRWTIRQIDEVEDLLPDPLPDIAMCQADEVQRILASIPDHLHSEFMDKLRALAAQYMEPADLQAQYRGGRETAWREALLALQRSFQ
eukprot:COSAG02_NODE_6819_length_3343_cov_1.865906_2_plen_215_part_01